MAARQQGRVSSAHRRVGVRGSMVLRLSALVLLSAAVPVFAEGQPATPPDPAALAEAPAYFERTGKAEFLDAVTGQLRPSVITMLMTHGVPREEAGELADSDVMPEVEAAKPELKAKWLETFAQVLTADDMKALEAFYATPAGQHVMHVEVALSVGIADQDRSWAAKVVRDAMDHHAAHLREHGFHD